MISWVLDKWANSVQFFLFPTLEMNIKKITKLVDWKIYDLIDIKDTILLPRGVVKWLSLEKEKLLDRKRLTSLSKSIRHESELIKSINFEYIYMFIIILNNFIYIRIIQVESRDHALLNSLVD